MPPLSRLTTPLLKNTGSTARDHLASERTYLAWIRTGLGFIALGIAVERFSQLDLDALVTRLLPPPPASSSQTPKTSSKSLSSADASDADAKEQALVSALLGTGSGSIVYGTVRYFSNLRLIERGEFKPAFHGVAILSVAVAGMAGASYWNTLRHGEKRKRERERERDGHGHGGGGRGKWKGGERER